MYARILVALDGSELAERILPHVEALSRALGLDLIAMTTHGRTGLGRLIFGSVAGDVLHRSTRPILLVRVIEHAAQSLEPAR